MSQHVMSQPLVGDDSPPEAFAKLRGLEATQILLPMGCDAEDALICFWACEHRDGSPAPKLASAIEFARIESRVGLLTWRPASVSLSDHDRVALQRYYAAPGLVLFAASRLLKRVEKHGTARERDVSRIAVRNRRSFAGWGPDLIEKPSFWER